MITEPIGGFFELEQSNFKGSTFHKGAVALTSGRACLSLIIEQIKPYKIYAPYYSCSALYEPIINRGVKLELYSLNEELEPINLPEINKNELIIYINYFGIKEDFCNDLINKYQEKLVIDNTHSFFNKGYNEIYSFTSARKYFGVPDGAYLYSPKKLINNNYKRNSNVNFLHNKLRLERKYTEAYKKYIKNEKRFNCEILKISEVSEEILDTIDYLSVIDSRIKNFNYLHIKLNSLNLLKINIPKKSVPFCYPLLLPRKIDKKTFHEKGLFIPTLWPDVVNRYNKNFVFEKKFTNNLIPIPIDHRYKINDMDKILNIINETINE